MKKTNKIIKKKKEILYINKQRLPTKSKHTNHITCAFEDQQKTSIDNEGNCRELATYLDELLICSETAERFAIETPGTLKIDTSAPDTEEINTHLKKPKTNKTSGEIELLWNY